eukprot:TsM_001196300 transcript=TsM_001196300 gene=TsM_001196300
MCLRGAPCCRVGGRGAGLGDPSFGPWDVGEECRGLSLCPWHASVQAGPAPPPPPVPQAGSVWLQTPRERGGWGGWGAVAARCSAGLQVEGPWSPGASVALPPCGNPCGVCALSP